MMSIILGPQSSNWDWLFQIHLNPVTEVVCYLLPTFSAEDRNRSSFQNGVFFGVPEDKPETPVIVRCYAPSTKASRIELPLESTWLCIIISIKRFELVVLPSNQWFFLQVGDPQEVNTIADVFCKDRNSPLLIGSVKSNMGHSEPASGLCSIAKVLIAMESGVIPPNLHYQNPNPDIPALSDGRLEVSYVNHMSE